jgi:hypothetical protein
VPDTSSGGCQPEQEGAPVLRIADPFDEAELDVAARPEEHGAERVAELAGDRGRRHRFADADDRHEGEVLRTDAGVLDRGFDDLAGLEEGRVEVEQERALGLVGHGLSVNALTDSATLW